MSQALDVTDTTWDETVIKSDIPVLVDFWAEWCGPCKAMGPAVDKLAEELGAELRVVKLDTESNSDTAAKYGVMSIPTFLLIKNGEVVHTMMGAKPYDAFKAEVVGAL
ncbi:MAG: thioredoxin [Planctomycetota bacterium]|jgi:thioredoxin 1|nr:thioredoxin [Planctomycetota bacterium]